MRPAWVAALMLALAPAAQAQLLGVGNGRSHPELRWSELVTEHFIVIYHQGLEAVARRAAAIAEQVYEPITRGLDTEMGGKTSLVLTAEDETVNGFALPRRMFVWVNVNDYAARFVTAEKWLRLVIAHEFQHVVWMEAAQDWTGTWSLLRTPTWFAEGLAEHATEEWGAYRSDLRLRSHILRNRHQDLDPHDSGFSMVRYLSSQYGDSVIVQAVKHRGALGLADFSGGFRRATGVGLGDFREEWRRAATAHTYALFGQKEQISDVGEHLASPLPRLQTLTYAPDGKHVAVLARPAGAPASLFVQSTDSTGTTRFVDHGVLDADFAFSPDGSTLVYAKQHRSRHGSLLWDLKVADLARGKTRWITSGRRASHPHWSPREERIVFTAVDGSTTNLYTCAPDGGGVTALTRHADDVQVLSPRFSPNGAHVAFTRFEPGGSLDIVVLDLASGEERRVTASAAGSMRPLWSPDATQLYFTSARNADDVPNLYTVPATGRETDVECMTDVGEAIFAVDVHPDSGYVVALALATTDSVRLRKVAPGRRAPVVAPVIAARFVDWRHQEPAYPIAPLDTSFVPATSAPRPYRAWRHLRTSAWFALPSLDLWGAMGGAYWTDTAHRHSILLSAEVGSDHGGFGWRWLYGRWDMSRLPLGAGGFGWISGGMAARLGLRLYGEDLLTEVQDHVTLGWRLPLNFGEHLYANHDIEVRAAFAAVDVHDPEQFTSTALAADSLPQPLLSYQENTLSLLYSYRKAPPHKHANAHAERGHGLLARFDWAPEALGSETRYRRLSLDASAARRGLPLLGGSFLARLRAQALWGSPAPQDFTGLRADPTILPPRYGTAWLFDDILAFPDAYALRGFPHNVPGAQALATTLEWRLPLTPALPVTAFGFSLGGVTGVFFYEHGRVWGTTQLARHTAGWEVRVPLRFAGRAVVVPSYGEGQTLAWERDGAPFERDAYFRLAMVQPF